jgi:hypothetical protein
MQIISHRGAWESTPEKNTVEAFVRSFKNGFGTETDLRDYNGQIVISHDIATADCMTAANFFELYKSYDDTLPLALNIKSDGLHKPVADLLEEYDIKSYFFFDMSIPDTLSYMRDKLFFYSRQSEYEPTPALYDKCSGIWLDCFEGIWYDENVIQEHINNGKTVAIVSPDLHKRNHTEFWASLKSMSVCSSGKLILCTDFPFEAQTFFKQKNDL